MFGYAKVRNAIFAIECSSNPPSLLLVNLNNNYHVTNGGYHLKEVDGNFFIPITNLKVKKLNIPVPRGKDYNEVLEKAREYLNND